MSHKLNADGELDRPLLTNEKNTVSRAVKPKSSLEGIDAH